MHNRTASVHQPGPWQYASGNRLTQSGQQQQATRYQYNHSGHITQKTQGGTNTPGNPGSPSTPNASTTSYHYDAAQRLVHIEQNGQTIARYHYDPKGRRIAKTTGQGSGQTTTWYVYAEEGLIAEINEQGQTQKSYGWEPDSPWGTKILWQADHGSGNTNTNAKTYHYIHSDHLGTPQIATDKNGQQTWAQVSEAFGKATISANASTEINIRFPGQYYDKETGTHYNFHRDYDPSTGRYLQSDPIGLDGGVNFYVYARFNHVSNFDNTGLYDWINKKECTPEQRKKINDAVERVQIVLEEECSECEGGCVPQKDCDKLKNQINITEISCGSSHYNFKWGGNMPSACAANVQGKPYMIIYEKAYTRDCSCLAKTIFHELMHGIGYGHEESKRGDYVYTVEMGCHHELCGYRGD
ncbi:RHS repeat domain-containing protein [Vandammella animalimorsus]|uniref:Teneurin-like YD-shell domain-containing protein n=1 Tax=Vandammella animalimorsus TaxID=2029117 RepID=A0A2A2AAF4_9BURK|nr:RHS repeat-associated core domain-containing protein [Vandammella animalimorsus]PAT34796.1 hypothetical protein CK620_07975 [Vandammella animalimorsus]